MKKIFTRLLIVLSSLVVMSACMDGSFKDEPEFETREGLLKEQSLNDDLPGGFLITSEDGDVTPLRSTSINLSSRDYLGNQVEVTGVYDPEENVMEVTSIKLIDEEEKKKKAGIRTYENFELGFRVDYYNDWDIEEGATGVAFVKTEDDSVHKVVISQEPYRYVETEGQNGEVLSALESYAIDNISQSSVPETKQIGEDELDALAIQTGNGEATYYLYRAGFIYKIEFEPGDLALESGKEFNQMINSFQFIAFDENDTTSNLGDDDEDGEVLEPEYSEKLSSFESLPFKFKGKYPSNWYYAGKQTNGSKYHYGFSDEPVEDDNEIIRMDIVSESLPSGGSYNSLKLKNGTALVANSTSGVTSYIEVGGQVYKLSGPSEYYDLILAMTAEINEVESVDVE